MPQNMCEGVWIFYDSHSKKKIKGEDVNMIEIHIKTDGKHIFERVNNKLCTLGETALVIYQLESIKKLLLEKEFEDEFKLEKD